MALKRNRKKSNEIMISIEIKEKRTAMHEDQKNIVVPLLSSRVMFQETP